MRCLPYCPRRQCKEKDPSAWVMTESFDRAVSFLRRYSAVIAETRDARIPQACFDDIQAHAPGGKHDAMNQVPGQYPLLDCNAVGCASHHFASGGNARTCLTNSATLVGRARRVGLWIAVGPGADVSSRAAAVRETGAESHSISSPQPHRLRFILDI